MAEKTIFTGNASKKSVAFDTFLRNHAAAYLTSVKSANTVYFNKNSITMASIDFADSGDSVAVYSGDAGKTIKIGNVFLYAAFVCSGGIAFSFRGTDGIGEKPVGMALTKDDSGNTIIITHNNLCPSDGENVVYTTSESYIRQQETTILNGDSVNIAPAAALCPFLVYDPNAARYTPDVGFFAYRRYTEPGDTIIGGVRYLSNGLWCVKDEGV